MAKNPKRKSILVVEDEVITARAIAQAIEDMGYTPLGPALSGREAKDIAEAEKPDMVLLDIELKDADDGIELYQKIREIHDAPVIFITAYMDDATLKRAMDAGASGYLAKPFQANDLQEAVSKAFSTLSK